MVLVRNISAGPRGIHAATGAVEMLRPGEAREIALAAGERTEDSDWFAFGHEDAPLAGLALASLTVAALKALAADEGIDLGDAGRKTEILSAIERARAA
jgi:hypothetical protein